MPGSVTIVEAQAQPTLPADADFAVVVIGNASQSPLAAGMVSVPYSSPASLADDYGLGDGVDAATHSITVTPGNPSPPPVCFYPTPSTTVGVRGILDTTGITGTAVITQKATTPKGTYEPVFRVLDDGNNGNGGLIGTAGIILEASPDGGRTFLSPQALGPAFTIAMLIGDETTGVEYDIAPATTNAEYVALAAELRTDTLGHMANAVAHDGADVSAYQVALAASSPPTTVTEATAVVNLVRTAIEGHRLNTTAVHDSPDIVNTVTLAAATDTLTGINLAIMCKAVLNAHEGIAIAAIPAGLLAPVATIASPTTYTAAGDFISGGVTALDLYPRKLTITTAGVTPADAPATVDITGLDASGAAQTQLGFAVGQTATTVTTTTFWKGTTLQTAFAAADGTDATLSIGYGNGVHNSADVTNLVTSPDPTYGTLFTGDTWSETKTTPPMWVVTDLFDSSDPDDITGAFAAIAAYGSPFAIAVISEPVAVGNLATITAGINYNLSRGKRLSVLIRFRDPLPDETDAEYITAFRIFRASVHDNRIACVVGSGWLTDAFRGYVYFRSGLPAILARMQSFQVIPGQQGERMAQAPWFVARGPLENFTLVDTSAQPIPQAHDEAVRGGIDGPINGAGGGVTFFYQPRPGIEGTYVSDSPVMFPPLSQILQWQDRRIANGIETISEITAWAGIGGADILDDLDGVTSLDPDGVDALQTSIGKAIEDRYSSEFQNARDKNLVVITPVVSVDGAFVGITGVENVRLFGYTRTITLTFSATR